MFDPVLITWVIIIGATALLVARLVRPGKGKANRGNPERGANRPSLIHEMRKRSDKRLEDRRKVARGQTSVTRKTAKTNGGRK